MNAWRWISVAVCALSISTPRAAYTDDARSYLKDAKLRGRAFVDTFFDEKCFFVSSRTDAASAEQEAELRFDFSRGMVVVQIKSEQGETAVGINDEYCFEAFRKKGKHWNLANFVFTSDQVIDTQKLGMSISLERPTEDMYQRDFTALRGLDGALVGAEFLLVGQGVEIVRASRVEANISVAYTRSLDDGLAVVGECVFSGSDHLLPVSLIEAADTAGGKRSVRVDRAYELRPPERMVRRTREESGGLSEGPATVTTVDSFEGRPFSRSDFELSAYGLPEPAKLSARTDFIAFTPWFIATNVGVVCILTYFVWNRRRR